MNDQKWPPENLVIAALAELDSRMGISLSGDEVQVKVSAICKLLANPPPMLARPRTIPILNNPPKEK